MSPFTEITAVREGLQEIVWRGPTAYVPDAITELARQLPKTFMWTARGVESLDLRKP